MFDSDFAQELYFTAPDKVYSSKGSWYAMFDDQLSILTNANMSIRAFTYADKADYREAKRFIINTYELEAMTQEFYDS